MIKLIEIIEENDLKDKVFLYLAPVNSINENCQAHFCMSDKQFSEHQARFLKHYYGGTSDHPIRCAVTRAPERKVIPAPSRVCAPAGFSSTPGAHGCAAHARWRWARTTTGARRRRAGSRRRRNRRRMSVIFFNR